MTLNRTFLIMTLFLDVITCTLAHTRLRALTDQQSSAQTTDERIQG